MYDACVSTLPSGSPRIPARIAIARLSRIAHAQQIRFNMQDSNDTDADKQAKELEEPEAPPQLSAVALASCSLGCSRCIR
jgi:hypothetical protein